MDISKDFLSDMRSSEAQPSTSVPSAAVSDAMQEQDSLAAKIDATNNRLDALNTRLNDLISITSPTLANAARIIEEHFGKKVTDVCNRLLYNIDKQSQKQLDAIKDQTERSIYEINRVTNQATERIRHAADATVIPTMMYNILMALLFMSLSLNVTIATLNIMLWHHPSLATILWVFAGITAILLAVIYLIYLIFRHY